MRGNRITAFRIEAAVGQQSRYAPYPISAEMAFWPVLRRKYFTPETLATRAFRSMCMKAAKMSDFARSSAFPSAARGNRKKLPIDSRGRFGDYIYREFENPSVRKRVSRRPRHRIGLAGERSNPRRSTIEVCLSRTPGRHSRPNSLRSRGIDDASSGNCSRFRSISVTLDVTLGSVRRTARRTDRTVLVAKQLSPVPLEPIAIPL